MPHIPLMYSVPLNLGIGEGILIWISHFDTLVRIGNRLDKHF